MALFAVMLLSFTVGTALLAKRRVPLAPVGIGLAAGALALAGLPPRVGWSLLAAAAAALFLTSIGAAVALRRAYQKGDQDGLARWGRLALLLSGNGQWESFADMGTWRAQARTDLAGARPLLARAASRPGPVQPFYDLVLEARYGHLDVPSLIEQRWSAIRPKLHPLLLHLAITVLVEEGRTTEALSRLGRTEPKVVTASVRSLVLVEIAAATGDTDTLERLLVEGHPSIDTDQAEIYRAVADRARGDSESAERRLRSLDPPPGGRTAHQVARIQAHPTPLFDEPSLDEAARRGLALYRDLSRQAAPRT